MPRGVLPLPRNADVGQCLDGMRIHARCRAGTRRSPRESVPAPSGSAAPRPSGCAPSYRCRERARGGGTRHASATARCITIADAGTRHGKLHRVPDPGRDMSLAIDHLEPAPPEEGFRRVGEQVGMTRAQLARQGKRGVREPAAHAGAAMLRRHHHRPQQHRIAVDLDARGRHDAPVLFGDEEMLQGLRKTIQRQLRRREQVADAAPIGGARERGSSQLTIPAPAWSPA